MHSRTLRRLEIALFLGITALTVMLFVSFRSTATSFDEELARSADFDSTTWKEYRSIDYDVSFRYPERWELYVSPDALNPYIRVMAPSENSEGNTPVSGSISSTQAQVALFPKGIPASFQSGLPATYSLFEQSVRNRARTSTTFMLDDGTRFAELYRYVSAPATWSPSGFVWAQSDVRGVEGVCEAGSPVVSQAERRCDLLFGDRVIYTGRVRTYEMELVDAIVDSVRFYGNLQSELGSSTVAHITTPAADARVRNPLRVRGSAPSAWFFEDEIPIRLLDGNNIVMVETSAQADDDFDLSAGSRPFSASIRFSLPDTRSGMLIVEKANPSGAPQLSEQVRIPILF